MIAGQPLFMCDTNEELMEKIIAVFGSKEVETAFPEMPRQEKETLPLGLDKFIPNSSERMKNLVSALLMIDPSKRVSAKEALKFPIFDSLNADWINI